MRFSSIYWRCSSPDAKTAHVGFEKDGLGVVSQELKEDELSWKLS